jgi:RecB family exonuclease
MQAFLTQAATHIFEQHDLSQLSRVGVILPTRRGVYFFKRALAQQAEQPFLAPDVWAIDDFVMEMTQLRQIDSIALIFELYDVFKEIDELLDFDRFMTWANTLLGDFDSLDLYMVNAPSLFHFMSEARAIERWNITHWGEKRSATADKYFTLFENLHRVYEKLKERLHEKKLVYRGMAYRYLAEHVNELLVEQKRHEQYYFVGFNALSESEERIFKRLYDTKRAKFLWDTDDFYMESPDQEAGQWLRRYKKDGLFGGTLQWKWQGQALLQDPKKIHIVGVPNATMQAKVAGYIYQHWKSNSDQNSLPDAIVLGNETLLLPLLNSLDESVDDFNITMGLSLQHSTLFTLIDALFELQRNLATFQNKEGEKVQLPKFSHKQVMRVLGHPMVKSYQNTLSLEKNQRFSEVSRLIVAQNRIFLDTDELLELGDNDPLFQLLFSRWHQKTELVLSCFLALIDLFQQVYLPTPEAIETEYLYQFYLLLQRLQDISEARPQPLTFRAFKIFLYELIKQTKIPYSGEPVSPLQIMGMLESRTLDFERVIILSVNEGILPAGRRKNSLIPFDAAREHGLPTHTQQDAVMAYHFFRLLQRPQEVVLLHVESDAGKAEKSRFLLQIMHEMAYLNPNLELRFPEIQFDTSETGLPQDDFIIEKNEDIRQLIQRNLSQKGLFPSALNKWFQCTMQYYFGEVAKITEAKQVEDTLGADRFGNWVHRYFENLDKNLLQYDRAIDQNDLEMALQTLPQDLEKAFKQTNMGLDKNQGINALLYRVGEQVVKEFLVYQQKNGTFPVQILDNERTLSVPFDTEVHGQKMSVKIAGRIDKLDKVAQREFRKTNQNEASEQLEKPFVVRVIDYKTGKVSRNDLKDNDSLEVALFKPKNEKLRQLWLYKYLVLKLMESDRGLTLHGTRLDPSEHEVVPGIFSFRNMGEGFLDSRLHFEAGESNQQFIAASEAVLTTLLENLLDATQPFVRTSDLDICQYCDFARICER